MEIEPETIDVEQALFEILQTEIREEVFTELNATQEEREFVIKTGKYSVPDVHILIALKRLNTNEG